MIASGGAPYSDCLTLPADYSISLVDSWGDGWNGNTMTIGDVSSYLLDATNDDGCNSTFVVVLMWCSRMYGCNCM